MSTDETGATDPEVDDSVRTLLLLMPRLIGRTKRSPVPKELESFNLAPRHLSLLAYLFIDGELSVNDLAARLEVAPTTVSLLVGELSRHGVLHRREDDADRRRKLVSIPQRHHESVRRWLGSAVEAWRTALRPLSPAERRMFVATMRAYERALSDAERA